MLGVIPAPIAFAIGLAAFAVMVSCNPFFI
nr:MAG TPA: hypothetical protein [Caudoviricetes sp.]